MTAASQDISQLPPRRPEPGRRKRKSSQDQQSKVIVGSTYWNPRGDLDVAEWILLGRRLGAISRGVAWWIGDWVNYGNANFGEKYSRAARITGYDVQSLMNMSYVASRFDSSRRRENLSWSHHAELASLAAEYQEMWLDYAERNHLSVRGLRESVRTSRASRLRSDLEEGQPKANPGYARSDPATGLEDDDGVVCPQCGYSMEPRGDRRFPDLPTPGDLNRA